MPARRPKVLAVTAGAALIATVGAALALRSGRSLSPTELRDSGLVFLLGDGVDKDVPKGLALLARAADSNDSAVARSAALELVAYFELLEGDAASQASVLQWRTRAALCGDRDCAESVLARMLRDEVLPAGAEAIARAGAKAGSATCMTELGRMLESGRGTVTRDADEARTWYERADTAGEARGNALLALSLLDVPDRAAECVRRLETAAREQRDPDCAYHAAIRLRAGQGCEPDVARAAELFAIASDHGHAEASFELAHMVERGVDVPQDLARARTLMGAAAVTNPVAAKAYAQMCEEGIGGPVEPTTAIEFYRRAAAAGQRGACVRAAMMLLEGVDGRQRNVEAAEEFLRAGVKQGDDEARWRLSRLLAEAGRGNDEAFELALAAAAAGYAAAEYDLYWHYLRGGTGLQPDLQAANDALRRAADAGVPEAQFRYGVLLADGRGNNIVGDVAKAAECFAQARESVPASALQLGALYALGLDGPADPVRAADEYRFAAEHGITEAQFRLGVMLEFAHGIPSDQNAAYQWYHLAAAAGDQRAADRRQGLRGKMLQQNWQALEASAADLLVVDESDAKRFREQTWSPLDRRAGGRVGTGRGEGFASDPVKLDRAPESPARSNGSRRRK